MVAEIDVVRMLLLRAREPHQQDYNKRVQPNSGACGQHLVVKSSQRRRYVSSSSAAH